MNGIRMKTLLLNLLVIAALLLPVGALRAQESDILNFDAKKATPAQWQSKVDLLDRLATSGGLMKTSGLMSERRSLIIKGNKITTIVYNTGSITRPGTLGNSADLVWNRLGYGYEFVPLVAAKVQSIQGDSIWMLDDGMYDPTQGAYSNDRTLKWGWLPKAGYADPTSTDIAAWSHRSAVGGDLTRKPYSWPESWYNDALGRYVWPAYLGNDASSPDEEVYFVADDYTNAKWADRYVPFPDDSSKHGLGLDLECRFFQFNNPLAEDIIFLVYRVTNKSPRNIPKVYFGMFGDPHVGGYNDYSDDLAYFIPPRGPLAERFPQRARSMVYAWDSDKLGMSNLIPGYFGFKFLESPTNSINSRDDDDDGVIDESPFNEAGVYIDGIALPLTTGIADTAKYIAMYGRPKARWSGDENGNWRPDKDDVGLDGLPGTGDFGEGNGKPDIGYDSKGNLTAEPNFGIRDVNESDQIGLTSFYAQAAASPNFPTNDVQFTAQLSSDSIAINQEFFSTPGDNEFLYGSGPFALEPNGTQRFSIALMMGENLDDLLLNSETAQRVLESNYMFAQPPPKPKVTAIPGNGRVTLYWDAGAENTLDPLTNTNDFEGYKIYRSQDFTFSDLYTITDANGSAFLPTPLTGKDGAKAQFDLVNSWSGLHPVEYVGRGVKYYLGSNSGLVHEYVDSTVTNGVTYYYAVASYDHGFDSLGVALPPTECQIAITQDPVTLKLTFDQNTVAATPGPIASGMTRAQVSDNFTAKRDNGVSTGVITVGVKDSLSVVDGGKYEINFRTSGTKLVYDVQTLIPTSEAFTSRDTLYVPLSKKNLDAATIVVKDASGNTVSSSSYRIDPAGGRIRGVTAGNLVSGAQYTITYQYDPISGSTSMSGGDDNVVFDGVRLYVKDEPMGIDSIRSGWVVKGNTNVDTRVGRPQAIFTTSPLRPAPLDFQFVWNNTDTLANGKWAHPGDTLLNIFNRKVVVCPFRIKNISDTSSFRVVVNVGADSLWRPGREIVIITPPKYSVQIPVPILMAVTFAAPGNGTSAILPSSGDIFEAKTTKPFSAGDKYSFTTIAAKFDATAAASVLDRIRVVPNPYVVYSSIEQPGPTVTRRGDPTLQFRNLPPTCTIRIYTMVGELVDTIVKNDALSYASWQLLSYEGQRLAYGVYIYHVEVPGVGEKIGRFALIK
jgi:hypothetical protein